MRAIVFASCISLAVGAALARYDIIPPQSLIDLKRQIFPLKPSAIGTTLREKTFAAFDYGPIVMLGDSLTQRTEWSDVFGLRVSNRGIDGDTTINLLARLDRPEYRKPATVFLMIGINDVWLKLPTADILDRYGKILRRLADNGSTIYAQSILLTRDAELNTVIPKVNDGIGALCRVSPRCRYIDLNPIMAPQGILVYAADGPHLTPQGYAAWRDVVAPYMPASARDSRVLNSANR